MSYFIKETFDRFKEKFDDSLRWRDQIRDRFFRLARSLPYIAAITLYVLNFGLNEDGLSKAEEIGLWLVFGLSVCISCYSCYHILSQVLNPPAYRQSVSPLADAEDLAEAYIKHYDSQNEEGFLNFIQKREFFHMIEDAEFNDRINYERSQLKDRVSLTLAIAFSLLFILSTYAIVRSSL